MLYFSKILATNIDSITSYSKIREEIKSMYVCMYVCVLVAKDSGLISDEAYLELRKSLSEDTRAMIPPINALKDERNRQNEIVYINQITEVRGFLSFDLRY